MNYPSLALQIKIDNIKEASDVDKIFQTVLWCIDYIYDKEKTYSSKDHTEKEMYEFLESLTDGQFQKLAKFFETMPKLKHDVKLECKNKIKGEIHFIFQPPEEGYAGPKFIIEDGPIDNVDEIYNDLRPKIDMAIDYANSRDIELLSMPIHPFSRVSDQSVSDNQRYLDFLDRMQWPLRRLLITGIHVHVGVESGEMAIAVINGMIRYIPYLICLLYTSPSPRDS